MKIKTKILKYFIKNKLREISIFIFDIDGTFASSYIYYIDDMREVKRFSVKDGIGIKHLILAGVKVIAISSRTSRAVKRRLQELGVKEIYLNIRDKKGFIEKLIEERNWIKRNIAYMGDDYNDLPLKDTVGFFIAPKDAHQEIKKISNFVSCYNGGEGAIREFADLYLWGNGLYKKFYNNAEKILKEKERIKNGI